MPRVLEIEGFRFFFFSDERQEPPHVHDLTRAEIRRIRELTFEHQTAFVERWNEYFGR